MCIYIETSDTSKDTVFSLCCEVYSIMQNIIKISNLFQICTHKIFSRVAGKYALGRIYLCGIHWGLHKTVAEPHRYSISKDRGWQP